MSSAAHGDAPRIFLATPLHNDRVHSAYMNGVMQLVSERRGRVLIAKYTSQNLFMSRDILTAHFLRSSATHLLWVDSDMGWSAEDVAALLATGKDFIGGAYARKHEELELAPELFGPREGELIEVRHAAAGFLLLTRRCVEQMTAAHPELNYDTPRGPACALWSPLFGKMPYGEDVSFGLRWRKLGGKIWMHTRVVLKHFGDHEYVPAETHPVLAPPAE